MKQLVYLIRLISEISGGRIWPQGYKTFLLLNSAEHEIVPAHKC